MSAHIYFFGGLICPLPQSLCSFFYTAFLTGIRKTEHPFTQIWAYILTQQKYTLFSYSISNMEILIYQTLLSSRYAANCAYASLASEQKSLYPLNKAIYLFHTQSPPYGVRLRYPPPLICNTYAWVGSWHQGASGAAWEQWYQHDTNLYPRHRPTLRWHDQSAGQATHLMTSMTTDLARHIGIYKHRRSLYTLASKVAVSSTLQLSRQISATCNKFEFA